jgi:hypothetical protein
MIPCIECGKAFVFARVIETDKTYQQLVRLMCEHLNWTLDYAEIAEEGLWMRSAIEPLTIGDIVVYLDGAFFPVGTENLEFEGIYANHQFERLPHAITLQQSGALRLVLGDPRYWRERERPNRDGDS